MAKKESFTVAKKKLHMMKKLWQFHEMVMDIPLPNFASATSIKRYANAYIKTLRECFYSADKLYADLEEAGLIKALGYEPKEKNATDYQWPYHELLSTGLKFRRFHPYSRNDISGEMYVDEEAIARTIRVGSDPASSLKLSLSRVLEPIEKLLKSYPKPKTNGFQRIFGGTRYFKIKKKVIDLYENIR